MSTMVAALIAGVIGLLVGLAWCYANQIKTTVNQGKGTLQSIGDIVSGGGAILKQLDISKDDIGGLFKY